MTLYWEGLWETITSSTTFTNIENRNTTTWPRINRLIKTDRDIDSNNKFLSKALEGNPEFGSALWHVSCYFSGKRTPGCEPLMFALLWRVLLCPTLVRRSLASRFTASGLGLLPAMMAYWMLIHTCSPTLTGTPVWVTSDTVILHVWCNYGSFFSRNKQSSQELTLLKEHQLSKIVFLTLLEKCSNYKDLSPSRPAGAPVRLRTLTASLCPSLSTV